MKMVTCMLCSQAHFRLLFEQTGSQAGETIRYHVVQCKGCHLIASWPTSVAPLNGDQQYLDPDYMENHGATDQRFNRWNTKHHFIRKLNLLEQHTKVGRLLDVGCGNGVFLSAAVKRGWQAVGIDINPASVSYIQQRFPGIEIRNTSFIDAGFDDESFDVVTFIHILEHFEDPKPVLAEAYRILKPGGFVLIAVPSLEVRLQTMIEALPIPRRRQASIMRYIGSIWPPHHLTHFSSNTLRAFLELSDFEVLEVTPVWKIRPRSMVSLKVWLLYQTIGLMARMLRVGIHVEVLAAKPC